MRTPTSEQEEKTVAAAPAPSPAGRGAAAAGTVAAAARTRNWDRAAAAPFLVDWNAFQLELPPGEPEAVVALRRAAIERFGALGFPTLRHEEWRFTNLAPLARASFRRPVPAERRSRPRPAVVAPWTFDAAARLVFVNGRLAPELCEWGSLGAAGASPAPLAPLAPIVASLAAALGGGPGAAPAAAAAGETEGSPQASPAARQAVERYLGRHTPLGEQPFVALNTAFLREGALVVMPRGVVLRQPIHLLYLSTPPRGAGPVAMCYPRNLIVAEEGSQLTVVETYAGEGSYFNCGVTELLAGPGAVVDHYKVQRESRDAFHLATLSVHGERNSTISSHSISLGGGLVRNDVNAVLDGEGIDCTLNGLYLADGRQLVDNHMRVEHAKPHCSSHELYKGILDGKARSVFNGRIYVHKGAQKTDAKQSNRNLLLSPDAVANSNPQLEIFADDVKCTHGSTVGQLDEDAVFYLRSRGIGDAAARSLLTYAFAADVVARIKVEPVRRDLEEYLFARLPQGDVVRQAV